MPVIYKNTTPDGLTIGVWELSEPSEILLSQVELSDNEKITASSYKLETRKREWLAVRALLQNLTGKHPEILYTTSGKPYFANSDLHIGISHTKGFAAVVLHPEKDVAIDIEYPSDRILKVSDRFLSETEKQIIHQFPESLFQTIIWNAKEAMFKWWNEQEVVFKEHLRIKNQTFPNCNDFKIDSQIIKDSVCIELPLQCCINDQYVLVYTL